jgi:hypothetical protein
VFSAIEREEPHVERNKAMTKAVLFMGAKILGRISREEI